MTDDTREGLKSGLVIAKTIILAHAKRFASEKQITKASQFRDCARQVRCLIDEINAKQEKP